MDRRKYTRYIIIGAVVGIITLSTIKQQASNKPLISTITPTPATINTITTTTDYLTPSITPTPTIPKKYLIKTTFVPQAPEKNWDQPWQDACEEAAILTLHYFYQNSSPSLSQIKDDLLDLFSYQTSQGWGHDVNLEQIASTFTDFYGYSTQIILNPTAKDLENLIANNTPVLVTANGKTLFKENKNFRNGGPDYHALVILGYDSSKQIFTVHDVGTQHGAYFKYTYSTLLDSIHDLPDTGKKYINLGQKSVLVILPK